MQDKKTNIDKKERPSHAEGTAITMAQNLENKEELT